MDGWEVIASGVQGDVLDVQLEAGQRYMLRLLAPFGWTWPDWANWVFNTGLRALGLNVESIGGVGTSTLEITILT